MGGRRPLACRQGSGRQRGALRRIGHGRLPLIEIDGLTFSYGRERPVFEDFSWTVGRGESWAVIGSSGCGKSTLLYLMAGLLTPAGGSVRIGGERVERPRPATGLILQDHGLLPWATVLENAGLGFGIRSFYGPDGRHAPAGRSVDAKGARQRVDRWLDRLAIKELSAKYPGQLSGGQRQRTAIARTLALEPDLLLMDEPFSALDAPTREDLQNLVVELRGEAGGGGGLTTVVVTHTIEEAVFLGERILVLGHPPNRTPSVLSNPEAGSPEYRRRGSFLGMVESVRAAIGKRHESTV